MSYFFKNNRTLKKANSYLIYVNISNNCIYDISDIIIEYNTTTNKVTIICDDLPEDIKSRMLKYFKGDINQFIVYIEENLETFLSGKEPEVKLESHSLTFDKCVLEDKITSLLDNYVYPTQNVNINILQYELSKKNIYFFSAKKIYLQVNCKKCKESCEIKDLKTCKCGTLLKCNFIPTLDAEKLGSLFFENCTFCHLNPSNFQFNCANCFSNYQSNKIGLNTKFQMSCWKCNTFLTFCIKKTTFLEKKNMTFKVGTSLPYKGTCKHYKKSYRWFRFSCCQSVYPCDICHDLENTHPVQVANKMICGFCSKEQSVKSDCTCGMDLKKSTAFWEGGKVSRNKATMSRKDSKKYTK